MLSKVWRQLTGKPRNLDLKVRTAKARPVFIPLLSQRSRFPILGIHALAITECPRQCAAVDYAAPIIFKELNDKNREYQQTQF
jgi:hypothetical protein